MNRIVLRVGCWVLIAMIETLGMVCSFAADVTVQTAVSASEVFQRETFQMQIQISGSDQPGQVDVSGLKDFDVQSIGGGANNTSSVRIVNGQMTQNVQRTYLMNYSLVPRRVGRLVIPSFTVIVEGQSLRTQPVAVDVRKPEEIEGFKLKIELTKKRVYVGEPVRLQVVWYLAQNARNVQFQLPIVNREGIRSTQPPFFQRPGVDYLRVALGSEEVIAVRSRARMDGKDYTTLGFERVLIPEKAGMVPIEPATVAFEAMVGVRQGQPSGPFSSLFGRQQQEVYRKQVIPSNALQLEVLDLPNAGRPANFQGHVGTYVIQTSAAPTDVNVGDPITLTVSLSGPEFLDFIQLPPLQSQAKLASAFKIPTEMEAGKVEGGRKVFTQTIRAKRSDVNEIPALELPYFDTAAEEFRIARSQPIPLIVHETKVVTAMDAEGLSLENPGATAVEAWTRGIAHNYEGPSVLVDQRSGPEEWLRSPGWVTLIAGPPLAYAALLVGVVTVRRRNADPLALRARRVYGEVGRDLTALGSEPGDASSDRVLDCLRRYLGGKLRLPHGALTFKDVQQPLADRGVVPEQLEEVKRFMQACEASRYAGGGGGSGLSTAAQCLELVRKLEQVLK
jgi:hypothetical protein